MILFYAKAAALNLEAITINYCYINEQMAKTKHLGNKKADIGHPSIVTTDILCLKALKT